MLTVCATCFVTRTRARAGHYLPTIMDSHKPRVNAAMLPEHTDQWVMLVGEITSVSNLTFCAMPPVCQTLPRIPVPLA